ncbi:MAG: AAA family ATPase, partial [Wohlfahrtiimonas sp.]
ERYDELIQSNQISFVTFHQSFSYEDFVEGIRATTNDDGQIEYSVEDGIFKEICQLASVKENKNLTEGIQDLKDREVWKMSLGDTLNDNESSIYDECLENNYVLLGYGYALDYSNCNSMKEVEQKVLEEVPNSTKNDFVITAVNRLKNGMKIGDLIVVTDGNRKFRAIAEITGDYFLLPNEERNSYRQARSVKWLRVFESSIPVSAISTVNFSQMSIYQFYTHKLKLEQLLEYIQPTIQNNDKSKNYVLIIDEINRGNIANIFGELITLLEPSKRARNDDARSVTLPYSKEPFSVPNNLYVIGTMNTSDHSLTKLDLALRRRFDFVELLPDYGLLNDIEVHGVNIGEMLKIMNDRIEVLLGRDYLIGHSYFLLLKDSDDKEDVLADIFKNKIIPLLQEYFFEAWERIQWVLNDQNKKNEKFQFVKLMKNNNDKDYLTKLFGNLSELNHISDRRYQINKDAFKEAEAYLKILAE